MASIRKRGKGYQITVSNGRKPDGTQIVETATFIPDPDKTEKEGAGSICYEVRRPGEKRHLSGWRKNHL